MTLLYLLMKDEGMATFKGGVHLFTTRPSLVHFALFLALFALELRFTPSLDIYRSFLLGKNRMSSTFYANSGELAMK